ncbi:helix-turn-helix transcriptional regulator [Nocardiopsis sp. NPDC006139]|uniref:helix-turn-helix domain-containing protein n=1 Tax=Nocardiopsis sp. NPDC006139 TaxID=3154578 RepID=UPI0033A64C8A
MEHRPSAREQDHLLTPTGAAVTLARTLARARHARRLSTGAVARTLGVPPVRVVQWERGQPLDPSRLRTLGELYQLTGAQRMRLEALRVHATGTEWWRPHRPTLGLAGAARIGAWCAAERLWCLSEQGVPLLLWPRARGLSDPDHRLRATDPDRWARIRALRVLAVAHLRLSGIRVEYLIGAAVPTLVSQQDHAVQAGLVLDALLRQARQGRLRLLPSRGGSDRFTLCELPGGVHILDEPPRPLTLTGEPATDQARARWEQAHTQAWSTTQTLAYLEECRDRWRPLRVRRLPRPSAARLRVVPLR